MLLRGHDEGQESYHTVVSYSHGLHGSADAQESKVDLRFCADGPWEHALSGVLHKFGSGIDSLSASPKSQLVCVKGIRINVHSGVVYDIDQSMEWTP